MTNVKREVLELKEENTPELRVVGAMKASRKKTGLSAPLVLPSRIHSRPPRPELAVLGWSTRAIRLAGKR